MKDGASETGKDLNSREASPLTPCAPRHLFFNPSLKILMHKLTNMNFKLSGPSSRHDSKVLNTSLPTDSHVSGFCFCF